MARFLTSVRRTPLSACRATTLVVVLLAWSAVSPELHAQAPEQEQVINLIKKMGGQVQRDPKAPGQPAIGISLRGTNVTDADLEILKQLKSLQILNLSQTAITDAGLKPIESLPNLRNLILPVSITDAGLVHVKGLTQLESLNLLDSQVSDAGLVHLKGLRNLKILLLNGTKVTDAGLREIQQALPRARISR
jgi:Leucine-rich repeat (LRR) protein